jgi:hypothetical protein
MTRSKRSNDQAEYAVAGYLALHGTATYDQLDRGVDIDATHNRREVYLALGRLRTKGVVRQDAADSTRWHFAGGRVGAS